MAGDKRKRKLVMKKRYLALGAASLILGGFFLTLTVLTTVTLFRMLMFSFFLVLGLIDFALYSVFRRR